eukprot:m.429980 g.429980  ORF g.429980 m.429980 type:complete len:370 (-) comp21391_c1_seq1:3420-4529(-)
MYLKNSDRRLVPIAAITLIECIVLCSVPNETAASGIVWTSNPVLPNETVLLRIATASSYNPSATLRLCASGSRIGCSDILPKIQAWSGGVKFIVPQSWAAVPAVWDLVSSDGVKQSVIASLNAAEVWWTICEETHASSSTDVLALPATACYPGKSSLRVIGRAIGFDASACYNFSVAQPGMAHVRLAPLFAGGRALELEATIASCYTAVFDLPSTIAPGRYALSVKNALGGSRFTMPLPEHASEGVVTVTPLLKTPSAPNIVHVAGGDVAGLKRALAEGQFNTSGGRWTVLLAPGRWAMGRMDRLQVGGPADRQRRTYYTHAAEASVDSAEDAHHANSATLTTIKDGCAHVNHSDGAAARCDQGCSRLD